MGLNDFAERLNKIIEIQFRIGQNTVSKLRFKSYV